MELFVFHHFNEWRIRGWNNCSFFSQWGHFSWITSLNSKVSMKIVCFEFGVILIRADHIWKRYYQQNLGSHFILTLNYTIIRFAVLLFSNDNEIITTTVLKYKPELMVWLSDLSATLHVCRYQHSFVALKFQLFNSFRIIGKFNQCHPEA